MKKVFIALGSNVGNRRENIARAAVMLEDFMQIKCRSRVYETKPVGYADQRDFLNAALFGLTDLDPFELLDQCKRIERLLGRKEKPFKDAPREADIDILFYDDAKIDDERLTIPHPRWQEREFVVSPLLDLLEAGAFDFDILADLKEALLRRCRKERVFCAF